MRNLCADEIEIVAGGEGGGYGGGGFGFADITVTASSPGFAYDFMSMGSPSSFLGGYSYAGDMGMYGGGGGAAAPSAPTYPADWVDNDGDGIPDGPYVPPITVTANATSAEIQAANDMVALDLWTLGVAGGAASPFVAEWIAGLTLAQQALVGAATAGAAPLADDLLQEFQDNSFEYHLDQIQNPDIYFGNWWNYQY